MSLALDVADVRDEPWHSRIFVLNVIVVEYEEAPNLVLLDLFVCDIVILCLNRVQSYIHIY